MCIQRTKVVNLSLIIRFMKQEKSLNHYWIILVYKKKFPTWVSARIVVSNWKYFHLYNMRAHYEILANQGGRVGLASQIFVSSTTKKV